MTPKTNTNITIPFRTCVAEPPIIPHIVGGVYEEGEGRVGLQVTTSEVGSPFQPKGDKCESVTDCLIVHMQKIVSFNTLIRHRDAYNKLAIFLQSILTRHTVCNYEV